jgi:GNAT superfamily N-acetyltransferase
VIDLPLQTAGPAGASPSLVPWHAPVPVVRIRRIRETDAGALGRFYEHLSRPSLMAALGGRETPPIRQAIEASCRPDHRHAEGFVAELLQAAGDEPIVGHLAMRAAGPGAVELGIVVADGFRHAGIGHRLLAAGLDWAAAERIGTLSATMIEPNPPLHGLIDGLGLAATFRTLGGGRVAMTIHLDGRSAAA